MIPLRKLGIFLLKYFSCLRITFHELQSLTGFFIFLAFINQLVSGIMLALTDVTETMYILLSREEDCLENFYVDDFLFLHERGVDVLVFLLYVHLLRKIQITAYTIEQEQAWKHGVLLFLFTHVVIFFGLVLSCTHLSEITLTIVAQIGYTLFLFTGKIYWLAITDKTLNIDTLLRMAYLHYTSAFILVYYSLYHGIDMHYDWKDDYSYDGISEELEWWDEALISELSQSFNFFVIFFFICLCIYTQPEAITYELFTWGDIGMSTDVRFFGVAPHWYFRPFMGWLVACPFYYTGLSGLFLFFFIFYFQPNIVNNSELYYYTGLKTVITFLCGSYIVSLRHCIQLQRVQLQYDFLTDISYVLFFVSLYYLFSYLPYGRFFNSLGGNNSALLAYAYVYFYLSGTFLRKFSFYSIFKSIAV